MKNDKGFYDMHQPMSKTQPAKVPNRTPVNHGDGHDFNMKAKVTNPGSGYNDLGKGSGAGFNGAEKDASLAYMTERGKKGQVVNQFTATERVSRDHTHNVGPTAYNNCPIDEVYKPATSGKYPSPQAIVRPTEKKSEMKG